MLGAVDSCLVLLPRVRPIPHDLSHPNPMRQHNWEKLIVQLRPQALGEAEQVLKVMQLVGGVAVLVHARRGSLRKNWPEEKEGIEAEARGTGSKRGGEEKGRGGDFSHCSFPFV